jgi:hypothetical protein
MLRKILRTLFGPKYTLKDAMLILEEGFRNGTIEPRERLEIEEVNVQHSMDVYVPMPTDAAQQIFAGTPGQFLPSH